MSAVPERVLSILGSNSFRELSSERRSLLLSPSPDMDQLRDCLLSILQSADGSVGERMCIGDALSYLGDPRLSHPTDEAYWVRCDVAGDELRVGRFPVTNHEYRAYVDAGGYQREEHWCPEGLEWRSQHSTWPDLARDTLEETALLANNPVVGVSWYEAQAYARFFSTELPQFHLRMALIRGPNKRPYPWGEPFRKGMANTSEMELGRASTPGVFWGDRIPEGVQGLAGNVGEWVGDILEDQRLYSPGSWREGAMAAWVKARSLKPPSHRSLDLGFRLISTP